MEKYSILRLSVIDSTSEYARRNLEALEDGEVVLAEHQKAGRGRLGRKWLSPGSGNLTASLVLKPFREAEKVEKLAGLAQYASLVVCRLLESYGVGASVKWPNDVLVGAAKIAGILCQNVIHGERLLGCILGIGVNLNMGKDELPAVDQPVTSLNLILGKAVDRDGFLLKLLEGFFSDYLPFLKHGFPLIRDQIKARSAFLGRRITVNSVKARYSGFAQDIDQDGALVLLDDAGNVQHISLGDIQ